LVGVRVFVGVAGAFTVVFDTTTVLSVTAAALDGSIIPHPVAHKRVTPMRIRAACSSMSIDRMRFMVPP
jgi:hypothetical protein